jgi:hypothetical protein
MSKAKNTKPVASATADTPATDFKSLMADYMEDYVKAYPGEKVFYISSDRQVFLAANKADGLAHQNQLDKTIGLIAFEA